MGGVVEACCLQPIDVIKTRLQLDHTHKYKGVVGMRNVRAWRYESLQGGERGGHVGTARS